MEKLPAVDLKTWLHYISYNGMALRCAGDFSKIRELVMAAVKENGDALKYADISLKNDRDIVRIAVEQNAPALRYASENLRDDREIVFAAVKKSSHVIQFASERLKDDHEIVSFAVMRVAYTIKYVSYRLRDNYNIVLSAIRRDGLLLKYASYRLKDNHEICIRAVSYKHDAFEFMSNSNKRSELIMSKLMSADPRMFSKYFSVPDKRIERKFFKCDQDQSHKWNNNDRLLLKYVVYVIGERDPKIQRIFDDFPFKTIVHVGWISKKIKIYIRNMSCDLIARDIITRVVKSSTTPEQIFDVSCPVKKLNAHGKFMFVNFEKKISEYLVPSKFQKDASQLHILHYLLRDASSDNIC